MRNPAYIKGAEEALERFGVKLAGALQRRMPFGPTTSGAERLARRLFDDKEVYSVKQLRPQAASHRPTIWSRPAPVDSGSQATQHFSGIGAFGGV